MNSLEKILIIVTTLLAIAAVVMLMVPDASGHSGFQSLPPMISEVSTHFEPTLASIKLKLAAWTDSMQGWVGQTISPSRVSGGQDNPIDNAVKPVGSYGQQQKDLFGKPVEDLQR